MWKKAEESVGMQPAPTTMATYNEAVEKFSKSATAFMQQLQHLTQAREAYQQAMTASAELRNLLDAGDAALRSLVSELEQAISVNLGNPAAPDKKKPELVKVEAIRGNGESTDTIAVFP
jgi:exonuclease VII small subunit